MVAKKDVDDAYVAYEIKVYYANATYAKAKAAAAVAYADTLDALATAKAALAAADAAAWHRYDELREAFENGN